MADSSSSSLKENRSRRSWTVSAESSAMGSNGRSSLDSTERPKTQGGDADTNRAGPSGFSKLLEARRRRKKNKKDQRDQKDQKDQKETDELAVPTLALEHDLHESRSNESRDGISAATSSVAGSSEQPDGEVINLLTDDSEPDGTPPLTSHNSHTGFYTSSSPLIKTTTVNPTHNQILRADTTSAISSLSATGSESNSSERASRLPTQSNLALGVPDDSSSKRRSASPGRRFKGSSNPDKKAPNDDPEAASVKSGSSKSRSLFGRRGSLPSKRAQLSPDDDVPPLPAPIRTDLTDDKPRSLEASPMPNTPPHTAIPAPATTVTPPTPTEFNPLAPQIISHDVTDSPESIKSRNSISDGVTTVSPSGNMISHRRVRSASAAHVPSKLSNSISALTPLDEKTPGAKTANSNQQNGFFSSVFSAAQNALSNSLNTQQRNRPTSQPTAAEADKSSSDSTDVAEQTSEQGSKSDEGKPSAVETLGAGDLNFAHLDIDARPGESITTPDGVVITKPGGTPDRRKNTGVYRRDEEAAKLEDKRAARAVQAAYEKPDKSARPSELSLVGAPADDVLDIQSTTSLPKDGAILGDQTPPAGSVVDGDLSGGIKRTGSVRSRLARRHRGSSGATASTVGAIGINAIALGAPGLNASAPRLTGFAVASKKRNRDFHQLFRSVPEDDYLIEDYSCALQREIILAGRIYISEGHICFSSNILGWVTTLVISFDEVVAVEKESTAMVFPNAIAIQTLHARHTFRSLLSRESTYDLMVNIWKINHPSIKSSVNGTRVAHGTGDKTEKVGEEESESDTEVSDEDEIYDEDEEGDNADSLFEAGFSANASSTSLPVRAGLSRKTSNLSANAIAPAVGTNANGDKKNGDKGASKDAPPDFPGPTTHAPTEYVDPNGQYEKVIKDEVIPAPLGKVYSLVFGPESSEFMTKFLVDNQKSGELQFEGTAKGLTTESPTRNYSYIKPLYGSIGPKQTKCISTENLDFLDLEKAVLVTLSTQTPDVPSGNVFACKTKYLFTWAPNNQTRFLMTCTIEWSGKSWLKGPIEKGAIDGQTTFGNELVKSLQAGVVPRGRTAGGGKGKGRRKKGDPAGRESTAASSLKVTVDSNTGNRESWGLFEPVRPLLEPFTSILSPLWSGNVAIILIGILLYMAFFRSSSSSLAHQGGCPGHGLPQRLAVYEEMWRREETELWNWLEDRVGMDGMVFPNAYRAPEPHPSRRSHGGSATDERELASRLREEKVSDREMDHAIRTTRQRLDVLEEMMNKRKAQWEVNEPAKTEL